MKIVSNGAVINVPIGSMRGPAGPDGNPIGTVISYMGKTAPRDYLICDGTLYNRADFPDLAFFFQTQFGASNHFGGDGETTIAVPDLQNSNADVLSCIKAKESALAEDIYSLEEQIVGRWINGKPIYKRTWLFTTTSTYKNWFGIGAIIEDLDEIVDIDATIFTTDETRMKLPYYDTVGIGQFSYVNSLGLQFYFNHSSGNYLKNNPGKATILYTKTTDQATIEVPAMLSAQSDAIATTCYDFYQDYDKEVT